MVASYHDARPGKPQLQVFYRKAEQPVGHNLLMPRPADDSAPKTVQSFANAARKRNRRITP